jgi:hypothetical protein
MNAPKRSTQRPRRNHKPRGAAGTPKRLGPRPFASLRSAPDDPLFLAFWKQANGTLPETIGEADLSTLNSALGFLFGRLRQVRVDFERIGDNGRWGAFCALGAFHSFITLFKNPLEEDLHVPIVRLQDALVGLEQGRREAILKPVRRRGRAPSSHAYASMKGYAAATVQLLQQADHGDALGAVARQLRELGVRPERGSRTVTATTVRNWRNEVSSDVGRHGTAALMYDDRLAPEEQERFLSLPKDQAIQLALERLTAWVLSVFPELQKKLPNPRI